MGTRAILFPGGTKISGRMAAPNPAWARKEIQQPQVERKNLIAIEG